MVTPSEEVYAVKSSTLIAEMLLEVGIGLDFQTTDYDTFWEIVYYPEEDAYEMMLSGEETARPPTGTGSGRTPLSGESLGTSGTPPTTPFPDWTS